MDDDDVKPSNINGHDKGGSFPDLRYDQIPRLIFLVEQIGEKVMIYIYSTVVTYIQLKY